MCCWKTLGHLFGTDGFFVIGGNTIDREINVGLLKNPEWSGSQEAVRQEWQPSALQKQTDPDILTSSTALTTFHNQYKVSSCSIISSADLSTMISETSDVVCFWEARYNCKPGVLQGF